MKKWTSMRWKWALPPLFVLCAALVLGILSTYIHSGREPLYLTPMIKDPHGWDIYTMKDGERVGLASHEIPEVEPGETFYLSRVLTEELAAGEYTSLFLDASKPTSVFVDGELLYTTCPGAIQIIGQVRFPADYAGLPQRGEWVQCSFPAGFTGRTLTIAAAHTDSVFSPDMPGILFTSQAIETEAWMSLANHNAMPAAAFAVAAILLLGLLFFSLFSGGRDFSLLLLTGAALAHFFYYLREYSFLSLTSTALDTPWAVFLPSLMVLLPELYLTAQMRLRRRPCAVLVLSTAAISLIPAVTNLFGYSIHEHTFLLTLYVGILALLACAVLEARDGNQVFRIFLSWLGSISVCVAALGLCSAAGEGIYSKYLYNLFNTALDDPSTLQYWCGTTLFALCCAIGVYVLVHDTAATQTALAVRTQRLEQLDRELAVQKQFYEAKLSSEAELRAFRHDMRGHLSTISSLLAEDNAAEAARYLGSLENLHQQHSSEVFCGDPYMNAVLGNFAARFHECGVAFTCRCGVEGWTLPGMEVCLILNNALENALEASLRLPAAERAVKVQAAVRKRQLLFRISNRFDGVLQQRGALPDSIKAEKGHGYGLQNIRSTAQRLGGGMTYRTEDGCFILDVYFPLPKGAEKGGSDCAV